MCWFGDPLSSKACKVRALNLGGYVTRSYSARYGRTTPASWRPFRLVKASRHCSNWLILLEWIPPFSGLPSSLDEDLDDSELDCPLLLDMYGRWAFSFFLFAFRLIRRSFVGWLSLVFKKLCKHLLEGINRFFLSTNHRIVPSGPGLVVQSAWPSPREYLSCTQRLPSQWKSSRPTILQRQSVIHLLQCPKLGHCSWSGRPY